jgi:hypothetical protein
MQGEIDRMMLRTRVRIVGINTVGAEGGVASITEGRTLPLVQDDATARVAPRWGATVRELWICDTMGRVVEVIDLTVRSLAEPMNYSAIRDRLVALAR